MSIDSKNDDRLVLVINRLHKEQDRSLVIIVLIEEKA